MPLQATVALSCLSYFFFFSSRRRHTRCGRDWSSDVCSSDLGPMPTLLAVAEIVDKLQAICVVCGGPASRNQRLVNGRPALWGSPTILVGGRESYEARCRHCHKVPRADEDQTALL